MPHDRNGKLVEVGDIVMGRGYNVKHDIIGPVVNVTEAESCNLTIAVVKSGKVGDLKTNHGFGMICFEQFPEIKSARIVHLDLEYGATKDFEIIQKADGTDAA